MSKSELKTRPCAQCGQPTPVQRGVCVNCGATTAWFRFRVIGGCIGVVAGLIAIALYILLGFFGVQPGE